MLNWTHIATVYLKELRDSLRDRRTLISMIVIPTLVMPGIIFGFGAIMTKVVKQARSEATSVVIVGGADSPDLVRAFKTEKRFRVVEGADDFKTLISDKKVRVAVEFPAGFEAALKSGETKTVMIYHYEGEMKSGLGASDVEKFLRDYRERTVENRLKERGLP